MDLENLKPDIRYLKDMKEVVYDKEWLKTAPDDLELYYMYRGLEKKDDLRYDITVIPPRMLGQEFVKTKGHFHSDKYQEVYIVLEGKAIFLLQKRNAEDVYAIEGKKNDVVIVPPQYGHVTINPSNQKLKLANWISEKCKYDYDSFKDMAGACYFYTKRPAQGEVNWVKNKNYNQVPDLRFELPLKQIPEDLSFLN